MTDKTCVTQLLNNILIWWPYLTWTWPWSLLSIRSILICYILFISWEVYWQNLGYQLLLVPSQKLIRWKVTILTFDLTLTNMWSFKFFKLLKKYSSTAFVCRLAHLATATRSWVRQGGWICPPPQRARSDKYPSGAQVKLDQSRFRCNLPALNYDLQLQKRSPFIWSYAVDLIYICSIIVS